MHCHFECHASLDIKIKRFAVIALLGDLHRMISDAIDNKVVAVGYIGGSLLARTFGNDPEEHLIRNSSLRLYCKRSAFIADKASVSEKFLYHGLAVILKEVECFTGEPVIDLTVMQL